MPDASSCTTSSCRNVSRSERSASALLGGALLLLAARQLSAGGWVLLAAGAAMAYRSTTGYCPLYDVLDIDTTQPASR